MNISKQVLKFQDDLSKRFKYKPLPEELSREYRDFYLKCLPSWCKVEGEDVVLKDKNGIIISRGYKRIVIGDYGAFIEFSDNQAVKENLVIPTRQKYRLKENFDNTKYIWYSTDANSVTPKIYYQKHSVDYADYKPEMWYISPYECFV